MSIVGFLLNIHQNNRNKKKFKKIRELLITTMLTLRIHNYNKRITKEMYWKLTETKFPWRRLSLGCDG